MTDKEKIRAEIERLRNIADYQLENCKVDRSAWRQQAEVCKRLLSFIDSMQEEPDARIQYASREAGIKAHAEVYSFNIESELFQQLDAEQQKLWRKEIEQAVISGGYCGLSLVNDRRYDREEPAHCTGIGEPKEATGVLKDMLDNLDPAELEKTRQEMMAEIEQPASEDLEEELHRFIMEYGPVATLERCARHFAEWQKQQMTEKACKWLSLWTGLDDKKVKSFRESMEE